MSEAHHPSTPSVLQQLLQLALQMNQFSQELIPYRAELGDEYVDHVCESSEAMAQQVQATLESLQESPSNPFEDQNTRHDARNKIAVIRGFSDLMSMDTADDHPAAPAISQLRNLSDEFIHALDSIRDGSEEASKTIEQIFA